jgi:hypothetical protein
MNCKKGEKDLSSKEKKSAANIIHVPHLEKRNRKNHGAKENNSQEKEEGMYRQQKTIIYGKIFVYFF